ncbi:NUDIX hydrolase [Ottowia sp.]|uniref:NUDIX hydrolase n=1 Tax=Ottowia sp. TaxID=1898956 RepID=UPI002C37E14B|nr:NUDIX hydrolase [Ottowia sp.]HRN74338.1 NUDIX hydrolase [Ottowia sp.]HRQ01302.1 NUDIX hydrolase [Ottowia sp.]
MADLTEHPLGSQELIHGDFLHAFRDQVRLPDGSTSYREYLRHPGAVMIIPLLEGEDGALQLVLERQYRYPIRQAIIEFPAGKLDEGEAPLVCAQRELLEETGYRAREWARAGLLHPTVSYSTEFIEIWFARGLSLGQRKLDEGEFLEVFTATPQQLHDWCREGRITDGKTLIGALWVQNTLNGSWPLDWRPVAGDPGP